ncbi:MAG: Gfo/Idh/MocA family oxidoreductase [Verrucomicrobiota bacterium]|jgi:predicted dehydrogenase
MKSPDHNNTTNARSAPPASHHHDPLVTDEQKASKPDGEREAGQPAGPKPPKTPLQISRRAFLVAAGMAPLVVPRHVLGGTSDQAPSDKLRIACVGVGGMGKNYLAGCKDEEIVALCDLDHEFSAPVFKLYPRARLYKDFREMFDKEEKNFDALIVATPDHWHSHLALAGLAMNKHLYNAKPITRTIAEARKVKAAVLASKATTKASIQDSRTSYARATTELLLSGVIGPIYEIHFWTGTYSPSGLERPAEAQTPPAGMNWDQWCGPSPARPYHKTYHYGNWRPWWDFGTGTVGDFGCHALQMFHDELEMGAPDWVTATACQAFSLAGRVENTECMSIANIVQWHLPARGNHPDAMVFFYDGGLTPPRPPSMPAEVAMPGSGIMFVGEKGVQISAYYGGNPWLPFGAQPRPGQQVRGLPGGWLLPENRFKDFKQPDPCLPRCEKPDHYTEWVRQCKAGQKSITPVEFACGLTEFALIGALAQRRYSMPDAPAVGEAGKGSGAGGGRNRREAKVLLWDSKAMRFTNDEQANDFVDTPYRKEWDYKV